MLETFKFSEMQSIMKQYQASKDLPSMDQIVVGMILCQDLFVLSDLHANSLYSHNHKKWVLLTHFTNEES